MSDGTGEAISLFRDVELYGVSKSRSHPIEPPTAEAPDGRRRDGVNNMINEIVTVRRQWNDRRRASVRIEGIGGLHFSSISGGVHARAPRAFLHGYISCDAIIEGEVAHSCRHGSGPHNIKVCIVQKDNPKQLYAALKAKAA
jgi:hypothetical protein